MYPFQKPISDLVAEDILTLSEEENRRVDYKLDLSKNQDKARMKNELRKDITALANADGGCLVLGVAESNKRPSHFPGVKFFEGKSADSITQEISNVLNKNISPALHHHLRLKAIAVPEAEALRHFVVIGMEGKSWGAPHWMQLEGQNCCQFWLRMNDDNRLMRHEDLSRAFEERFLERSHREIIRDEALAEISAGRTPFGNLPRSLVLHVIPYRSRPNVYLSDVARLQYFQKQLGEFYWPTGFRGGINSLSFDHGGLVLSYRDSSGQSPPTPISYMRYFRNGSVEQVDCYSLRKSYLSPNSLAATLYSTVVRQVLLLQSLDQPGPYEVFLSLWNTRGLQIGENTYDDICLLFPGIQVSTPGTVREELVPLWFHIYQTGGVAKPVQLPTADMTYPPTPWCDNSQFYRNLRL